MYRFDLIVSGTECGNRCHIIFDTFHRDHLIDLKGKTIELVIYELICISKLFTEGNNLIEQTKQDIQDLEYISGKIDAKNLDLTIGKNIQTIKDLLMKVEKLIYASS